MPDDEKTCLGCGRTLPLSQFFRRKRGRGGYDSRCKDCVAKTPDQLEADRQRARDWRRDNPERHDSNVAAYRKRHPERRAARQAVYNAIKRGEMERQPCEVCGNPASQAHHDDYSRPRDVRWLCQTHHSEADRDRRAQP